MGVGMGMDVWIEKRGHIRGIWIGLKRVSNSSVKVLNKVGSRCPDPLEVIREVYVGYYQFCHGVVRM